MDKLLAIEEVATIESVAAPDRRRRFDLSLTVLSLSKGGFVIG